MIPGIPQEEWNRINKLFNKERVVTGQSKAVSTLHELIAKHNLVSPEVMEEIRKILEKELGKQITPGSELVHNAIFAISLTKIFKRNHKGEKVLDDDLKKQLQVYDALSPKARDAIAMVLGKGSKIPVDPKHRIVNDDLDVICEESVTNPDLLFDSERVG